MSGPVSVAIIGAGMSGVTLARRLRDQGANVTLFEKGRGIGGRMSTRRTHSVQYDHGAQFFTVRTPAFSTFLSSYEDYFDEWTARVVTLSPLGKPYGRPWFEPHYVCTPTMNALCKAIAADTIVHTGYLVERVTGTPGHWFLESKDALSGPFDWVVSTAPLPQGEQLLPVRLPCAAYAPVFALMVPLARRPLWDAAVVKDSPLAWLAVSSSRPGRADEHALVVHTDNDWSSTYLEQPANEVRALLLAALDELGLEVEREAAMLHRWRYGRVIQAADEPFFIDMEHQIAACGDWGIGSRVEDAFTSACHLNTALMPAVSQQDSVF